MDKRAPISFCFFLYENVSAHDMWSISCHLCLWMVTTDCFLHVKNTVKINWHSKFHRHHLSVSIPFASKALRKNRSKSFSICSIKILKWPLQKKFFSICYLEIESTYHEFYFGKCNAVTPIYNSFFKFSTKIVGPTYSISIVFPMITVESNYWLR